MGAWIETGGRVVDLKILKSHPTWVRGLKHEIESTKIEGSVAPYVGAWIETPADAKSKDMPFVAPYVGAWIETV